MQPCVALLKQAAQFALFLIGLALQHGGPVKCVGGQGLGVQHAMPSGFDELAPEIEIFPTTWNVAVSPHRLPCISTHQGHGIHDVPRL